MRKLYFGQPWNEPGYSYPWISFEDNAEFLLTGTKSKFCQACLHALKKGILSYELGQKIDIGSAVQCWKAVLAIEGARSPEEVRSLLEENQDDFLSGENGIHGKVGGGETPGQLQIMMDCDNIAQAELYKERMGEWLRVHHNHPLNSYATERGCKHPFMELFGPASYRIRGQRMKPVRPKAVRTVLEEYLQDSTIAGLGTVSR